MNELDLKLSRVRALLTEHQLDALLLRQVSSFAWATCGAASYVNTATSAGAASLLITPDERYVITTNIEAPRLEREERLAEQGWTVRAAGWHEASPLATLAAGLRLGADSLYPGAVDLSAELSRLRTDLTADEVQRYRALGRLCAETMDEAIRRVQPGMTEYQIAGLLAVASQSRGVQPIVNLIATDERIFAFRHPLPTGKTLERYAMLVLCGRAHGLVCSVTRLVHFGPLPVELQRKAAAVAEVDAAFIAATRPGRTLGEILALAQQAYADQGFADEWRLHHQGGPAGYEPREWVATPGDPFQVRPGQVYAWNPSITGVKSEDTILVGDEANEVITSIDGWPSVSVEVGGAIWQRPAILVID